MSAVEALAGAPDFTAEDYVQSYLESRGYVRDNPDTGAREAHILAFYYLMKGSNPLLVQAGTLATKLQSSIKNGSVPLNQILTDYAQFQQKLQEVDKAEQTIAQLCAVAVKSALDPADRGRGFYADDDTKLASSIAKSAGFEEITLKHDAWIKTRTVLEGPAHTMYDSLADLKAWVIGAGIFGSGTAVFGDAAQKVQAAVDSAADDDLDW